jgi:uncharacterized protein with ParB-like and HNH nuclease domain
MSENNEILGKARTVRELLSSQKYSIDYYQREYKWESAQVQELIIDLYNKFNDSYDPSHERSEIEKYRHYFLGSIIVSAKKGKKFLIDGQQRLTTLTLLLIFLNNLQRGREDKVGLSELIYSEKYAKKSFNLDVDERTSCVDALFNDKIPENQNNSESVQNIIARYIDIAQFFPNDLKGDALPYFLDWLLENVHLVEITAFSDEDAYTIFETMNDRGLSLTPPDMLKGFLLANITDEDKRNTAAAKWKECVNRLRAISKDDEANFFKAWLRSQYASSIRERKRGAKPGEFDLLGTEFHRWVRDNKESVGLNKSADYFDFIINNMAFYTKWYEKVRLAAESYTEGLEDIYFNGLNEFNLQYPILLATLKFGQTDEVCEKKLKIASKFVDILVTRRVWNYRDISAATMQYAMFLVMRSIRTLDLRELVEFLTKKVNEDTQPFESGDFPFSLHGTNRARIHIILARITDFIEQLSGEPSNFVNYMTGRGQKRYEVEHIWADHYERHTAEFSHPSDFQNYRNRIGALLLLPKQFNQSYGDLEYGKKLSHYLEQNLLARSLHPQSYEYNPGFLRFKQESGLLFEPHPEFHKSDIEKRQDLLRMIAEQVWDPGILRKYIN